MKFCVAKRTHVPLGLAKFHVNRCNESPLRGENADFCPVSKFNTGSLPLGGILPVITEFNNNIKQLCCIWSCVSDLVWPIPSRMFPYHSWDVADCRRSFSSNDKTDKTVLIVPASFCSCLFSEHIFVLASAASIIQSHAASLDFLSFLLSKLLLLYPLQCFDVVGWATGTASDRKKILILHSQRLSFGALLGLPNLECGLMAGTENRDGKVAFLLTGCVFFKPLIGSFTIARYDDYADWWHISQSSTSVMSSETVGLRTRPVWDQKNRSWVLQVWCCFVKHDLVTLVVIMILEGHSHFSSTIYSFSILCLEHHYCGDQQWRSLT